MYAKCNEIQECMDEYEDFFDEYCEFMTSYSKSDNVLSPATQYANFGVRYTATTEAFEAWEDEDMSDAEAVYYIEVSARITQKLLTITAE